MRVITHRQLFLNCGERPAHCQAETACLLSAFEPRSAGEFCTEDGATVPWSTLILAAGGGAGQPEGPVLTSIFDSHRCGPPVTTHPLVYTTSPHLVGG